MQITHNTNNQHLVNNNDQTRSSIHSISANALYSILDLHQKFPISHRQIKPTPNIENKTHHLKAVIQTKLATPQPRTQTYLMQQQSRSTKNTTCKSPIIQTISTLQTIMTKLDLQYIQLAPMLYILFLTFTKNSLLAIDKLNQHQILKTRRIISKQQYKLSLQLPNQEHKLTQCNNNHDLLNERIQFLYNFPPTKTVNLRMQSSLNLTRSYSAYVWYILFHRQKLILTIVK
eukprot:TRINITY_DN21317_c0_g2_i2.p1 TRINITY_DN21317_c0_g2~~TRINITY_DN21317_c0_g2_i2.p1  ORF type:complete len:241 (-),score=-26.17 TRINITY_DN21317_c0_g2_i2:272-964(-)